jgi:hypothetical protein
MSDNNPNQNALKFAQQKGEQLFSRAVEHHLQKRLIEAETDYYRAVAFHPEHPFALNNLGVLLMERGCLDEAIGFYRRALLVNPDFPEALNNLGNVLKEQNRLVEAIEVFAEGLRLKPDMQDMLYNDALAHLKIGNMPACWLKFESRWQTEYLINSQRDFSQPRYWGDVPLSGKSILLNVEQGMGDTLQMVRYVRQLRERGAAKIYLEVQPMLKSLLSTMPEVTEVYAKGEQLPDFDTYCPIMSLPLVFATTMETLPRATPYIRVRPELVAQLGEQLSGVPYPRVGVCWKGNPAFKNDKERSPGLEPFRRLLSVEGAHFVTLVPQSRPEFMAAAGAFAFDLGRELVPTAEGFEETAALIMNLDLVITSDTAVCHLAGALGKPVWLVLTYVADWRWLTERDDSPWYPTARLFRQTIKGDWAGVLERIADLLRLHLAQGLPFSSTE